eukprot:3167290-Pleurochrysis_carterae.AAC.3
MEKHSHVKCRAYARTAKCASKEKPKVLPCRKQAGGPPTHTAKPTWHEVSHRAPSCCPEHGSDGDQADMSVHRRNEQSQQSPKGFGRMPPFALRMEKQTDNVENDRHVRAQSLALANLLQREAS